MKTEQEIRQMIKDLKVIINATPGQVNHHMGLAATCVGLLWVLGVEDETTEHMKEVRDLVKAYKGVQTN